MSEIRPLAIGLFRRDGALLAVDARDPATGERFCRPVGGEIEVGEAAAEALACEVAEELGERVCDVELLAVLENHFEYAGAPGHEIVFVFDCSFAEPAVYHRPELNVGGAASGARRVARKSEHGIAIQNNVPGTGERSGPPCAGRVCLSLL